MLAYAITQAVTQSRITFGVLTGLILPDQTLNELEDRGQYLLDEVHSEGLAGTPTTLAFFFDHTPQPAAANVITAPTISGS